MGRKEKEPTKGVRIYESVHKQVSELLEGSRVNIVDFVSDAVEEKIRREEKERDIERRR